MPQMIYSGVKVTTVQLLKITNFFVLKFEYMHESYTGTMWSFFMKYLVFPDLGGHITTFF